MKDVEIMIPLKYLSNSWRTLEIPLINFEVSHMLTWSTKIFFSGWYCTSRANITIIDTKLYVPVLTLSIQDNVKLLKQLESDFKRTIDWNNYQSKITEQTRNRYLDFLTDPSLQAVNTLFVSSFENRTVRESHKRYFLLTVEVKLYNVMIDGKNFVDQPVKNKLKTYDNIRKTATGQDDDYTTGCLLDYPYFKE